MEKPKQIDFIASLAIIISSQLADKFQVLFYIIALYHMNKYSFFFAEGKEYTMCIGLRYKHLSIICLCAGYFLLAI